MGPRAARAGGGPAAVAAGAFESAADAPGVTRDRGQSSDGREAVGVAESSDVPARGGQELGAEDNAEAGHAQDNFGVAVPAIRRARCLGFNERERSYQQPFFDIEQEVLDQR